MLNLLDKLKVGVGTKHFLPPTCVEFGVGAISWHDHHLRADSDVGKGADLFLVDFGGLAD